MAVDWLADVRIYDADADESVVNKIVNYCGIALQSRDGQLVAMADPKECETVRENFLKKKLGLTQSDAVLDEAIQSVREVMKADRTKNRVTVYYLLTKHFGSLNLFGGVAGAAAGAAGLAAAAAGAFSGDDKDGAKNDGASVAPLAAAAGIAGAGVAAVTGAAASAGAAVSSAASGAADLASDAASSVADTVSGVAGSVRDTVAAPLAAVGSGYDDDNSGGGFGWLKWLLLAALLAALLFFLLKSCSGQEATPVAAPDAATVDAGETATGTAETAPAAAEATPAAVPTGSGVVAGERNGKPMLTVYFETAKTNLPTDFDKVAAVIKDYSAKNPGAKLAVSGFNSPTGSAAGNERLSKGRAENVSAALQKLGVAAGSVELVKPAAATQGAGEDANARRVEVVVQ
jgi:outer membrane protein OmpA-like peptidoglycan-associated protein